MYSKTSLERIPFSDQLPFMAILESNVQKSRKAYGTAVSGVVIYLNKIHLNHSQRGAVGPARTCLICLEYDDKCHPHKSVRFSYREPIVQALLC